MTGKTYQYVAAIGVLTVIAGIIVAINYNKSQQKEETSKKNNVKGLLAGLGTRDTDSIFGGDTLGVTEAIKMTLPLSLKNTIMSFENLEYLTPLPVASPNTAINPFMNRGVNNNKLNIPKLKYPQNIREGVFYIQVGNRVITRTGDDNKFSDLPFNTGDLTLYQKKFDLDTKSATTNLNQEMYMPFMFKYAPRGKVKIEDSVKNVIIDTENDFVQDFNPPVNIQNIKINVAEGCTILITTTGGISSINGPVVDRTLTLQNVSKIEVQTPGYYDFFLKNFVGPVQGAIANDINTGGNFNNIIIGDQEFKARTSTLGVNTFPPNKIFYLIHGIDGSMLRPDQGGLVYADQWTTWGDANSNVKRNEINFIPTGDKDNSYYIKFVSNGGLFNAKDDNWVDWNGKIGSNSAKWWIGWSGSWQNNGIGSYLIRSVSNGNYLTWSGQTNGSWVTLTKDGSWLGIYDETTIGNNGWTAYLYKHTSLQGDGKYERDWNDYIPDTGTLIQYARNNGFQRSGYGVDDRNRKYWHLNKNSGSGGNWNNHALLQANKKTPQEPKHTLRTLKIDTKISDDNSCRFRVELDERNRMFIKHVETGLYLSSYTPYLVSKDVAFNMDHAVVTLHPVLTTTRARDFFTAAMNYMNNDNTTKKTFCNYGGIYSTKFPDGTLKVAAAIKDGDKSLFDKLTPVEAAFSKICACNLDSLLYQQQFCSDKYLREMFGSELTDSQIRSLRDTLKCESPNCVYNLCQDAYKLGGNNFVKGNADTPSEKCGASTICFNSINVTVGGNINAPINATSKQSCGNEFLSKVTVTQKIPQLYMWDNPQIKNIIIADYTCQTANDNKVTPLLNTNQFCKDKVASDQTIILYNFTNSTMSRTIQNRKIVYTISDVLGGMLTINEDIQDLIKQKFNIPGNKSDYNWDRSKTDKKITITSRNEISCGQPQTMCEYVNGKWVTKSIFTRVSTSPLSEAEFKEACVPSEADGCATQNDCMIGQRTIGQSCSPSTSQEILNFPITRLPSGSGKSCEQVVGSISNMSNYQISTENNVVKATKICSEDNKWDETCVAASGTDKLVQKISQCIPQGNVNCVDKVCIDWSSDATIQTEFIPNPSDSTKGTKRITVNLTSINPAKLDTPKMQEFIRSRLGLNDIFNVTTQNNKLIITINYNCGTVQKQSESQCVYEGGKWVQNFNNVFINPVGIQGTEFAQQCKSTTNKEDCKESKNCELIIDRSISSSCVGGKQKMGLLISKNPSASGKSCMDVAKEQNPDFVFNVDTQVPNRILGEKTCTVNNEWKNVCEEDSANTNRLLNKIKECLPTGNDECKDKVCIDWSAESTLSTRYDPVANDGKGKKVVTITMRDIDRNLIQSDPAVRRFIQSRLSTTDNVTYTYDGNKLEITVDYSCGSLEKTYAEDCEIKDGGWIRRYTQIYKNPKNIESAKFDSLCAIPNRSGSDSCDINKDCEVLQDTTLSTSCANNKQRVGYKVQKSANKDGKSCTDVLRTVEPNVNFTLQNGVYVGEKACSMPVENVDCVVGNFGPCSVPCGGGTQTASILTQKQGNGRDCGPTSRACNTEACPPPSQSNVDCKVGDWGECSVPCGGGTQTAPILVNKQGNGQPCSSTSRACNTQECPPAGTPAVDCVVGNFGECSKPCGGGKRGRPIITDKQGNGAACPPLFENCNTHECPKEEKKEEDTKDKTNTMLIGAIGVVVVLMIGGGVMFAMKKK
jgi:hypothetical protein